MKKTNTAIVASLLALAVASPAFAAVDINTLAPVTDEVLANPADGDWPSYGRNITNYRFSPLDQINKDNVNGLQLVWSRAMEPGNMQAAPLEYQGVVFTANPGDVLQAIDATNGKLIWEYRRQLPDTDDLHSLGANKRGIALYEDKVYMATWDNFIVALDMKTGQLVWETDRGGGDELISNTSGPIIANGVVIAGSTCQYSEFGCYATGHDAATGEELWRNTFIPQKGEPGDETWGDSDFEQRWMTGAWGQMTYDPVTDLVFYGSTGTGPASEVQRNTIGGTMAGTNTRFAVKPQTGEIVWQHQTLPRDNWDQECTFEMIPTDVTVNPSADMAGKLAIGANASGDRRVLTGVPCKTGVMWQFDAATGEFLWARETTEQTIISSIDETGLVTVNEDMVFTPERDTVDFCPSYLGGRDWNPSAFNPTSKVMFVPLNDICATLIANDQEPTGFDVYNTKATYRHPEGKTNVGRVDAISVETGETVWSFSQRDPLYAPISATAGGLIFVGGVDRVFKAIDQETGEIVWSTILPAQVTGHPISYEHDGVQYISVTAGGPSFGASLLPPAGADYKTGSNAIFTFALPKK